jgi:hypothetical protein
MEETAMARQHRLAFLNHAPSALLAAGALSAALCAGPAAAQSAVPPYVLSTFASPTTAYSQPDSIVQWRDSVLIGYQNHVAKDGTDGKSSTIVQYSLSGTVQRTFSVGGHNDGLRVVGGDQLWALQNEDANPTLVVIDLVSGTQTPPLTPAAPHGGGYDDLRVLGDDVFMTASNPNLDASGANVFPALVRVSLSGSSVDLQPVLYGNSQAVDIVSGKTVTLNLTDPDSLSVDARGNLVVNSQADAVLVFVRHPLADHPQVGVINITRGGAMTTVDDTAFAPRRASFALFSDVSANTVYRLDSPMFGFEPGTAYSTSDTAGIVAVLNLDNGDLTPIATGFASTRGMIFVSREDPGRAAQDHPNH